MGRLLKVLPRGVSSKSQPSRTANVSTISEPHVYVCKFRFISVTKLCKKASLRSPAPSPALGSHGDLGGAPDGGLPSEGASNFPLTSEAASQADMSAVDVDQSYSKDVEVNDFSLSYRSLQQNNAIRISFPGIRNQLQCPVPGYEP